MQITEARIKLVSGRTDRLKAFCTITFDNAFVVRDLKIIEGADGYFVAMPSRKLTDRCNSCGSKNTLRSRFCSECGARLGENRARRGAGGRTKLHADVAHPVNSEARAYIQKEIEEAYHREVELSKQPGYRPVDLGDDYEENYGRHLHHHEPAPAEPAPAEEPQEPAAEEQTTEESTDKTHNVEPGPGPNTYDPDAPQSSRPRETSTFGKGVF